MDSSIKALHRNIAEWLAGPTGALVFHVLLLLALLFLVDFTPRTTPVETLDFKYIAKEAPPPDQTLTPLQPLPPAPKDLEPPITPPDVPPDLSAPPDVTDFTQSAPAIQPDFGVPDIKSPIFISGIMPGSLKDRIGADAHKQSGQRYYGPGWEYAEDSVRRALEWLRINQNQDGSWGTHDCEAMAGLGLLTFLAHGETTTSEQYAQTVVRAIRYLVARQNDRGEFCRTDTTAGTYGQAICVYAVSEAYGMTRIPSLKPAMEKGVQLLIDGQQAAGGFDYKFAQGDRRDTSLGGWCCQAMKAAFIAGAENATLHEAMELAVADMKSVQKPDDGSFYYSKIGASHATHSITAVAVLSMQLLGHAADREVARGLDFLGSAGCNWKNPPEWPMYAWYYISQAKFHEGGAAWSRWNNQFAPQLIRNQNPDGSWNSAGLGMREGVTGRENMHPAYATTLAALTLQVYYRNLPTYKPIQLQKPDQKSADDVKVQIL